MQILFALHKLKNIYAVLVCYVVDQRFIHPIDAFHQLMRIHQQRINNLVNYMLVTVGISSGDVNKCLCETFSITATNSFTKNIELPLATSICGTVRLPSWCLSSSFPLPFSRFRRIWQLQLNGKQPTHFPPRSSHHPKIYLIPTVKCHRRWQPFSSVIPENLS